MKLDDIALFLSVAEEGGLAGASRRSGVPLPTLSRRMTALERTLGLRLFVRGAHGYALTPEGRALAAEAEDLGRAADRLRRFASDKRLRVRITAGLWTCRHLARNVRAFWNPSDDWVPEFLSSNVNLDLARREADIGIRNRRPEQDWLAGRRTGRIEYTIYATSPEVEGYVTLSEGLPATPSERHLRARKEAQIVTTASDARMVLELALAGIGRILMPTFAGDSIEGLHRMRPPIEELAHDEWLVAHHDARNDPPIRKALDGIAALLTARTRDAPEPAATTSR